MASYTWEFGAEDTGLWFTIVFEDGTFTVKSNEGSFDLNALWWATDDVDGNYSLAKQDNSLNMNGSNTVWDDGTESSEKIDWDGYLKLSNPGLGTEGEDKSTFISADDGPKNFDASVLFDPAGYAAFLTALEFADTEDGEFALGVRATSVSGGDYGDSIKWVDKEFDYVADVDDNNPPVANDDRWFVSDDTVAMFSADAVLANDSDPDGDPLTITQINGNSADQDGIITSMTDGGREIKYDTATKQFTLTVDDIDSAELDGSGLFGEEDSFQYTISDGQDGIAVGTVNLTLIATHDGGSPVDNINLQAYTAYYADPGGHDEEPSEAFAFMDLKAGADTITAMEGHNILHGGDGNDTYRITPQSGNVVIFDTGGGNDNLHFVGFGSLDYLNFERVGDDMVIHFNDQQIVVENHFNGNPIENVNFDDATYLGFALGSEDYNLQTSLNGTGQIDVIAGSSADESLGGGNQGDLLFGNDGNDVLDGGANQNSQHNLLIGGAGNDVLIGNQGNDVIVGGKGADTMTGGANNDTFVWLAGDMDDTDEINFDAITDWGSGSNTLDISRLLEDFGFPSGGVPAEWVNVTESGGNTIVAVDPTGVGGTGAEGWLNLVTLLGVTGADLDSLNIVYE